LQEFLVRDLVIQSHKANVTASGMASQLSWLEVKHLQDWHSKGK
jgi:hypothetical protein